MVSQFPPESMHLVHQGAFKRLLSFWTKEKGPWKLHRDVVARISALPNHLSLFYPSADFNRPPRSLEELKFYKATELRRLLLYAGILVFKGLLDENIYKNFLLLHVAIFILSSEVLVKTMTYYADQLLRTFITHSVEIYGRKFVVFNVHALCHLSAECKVLRKLGNFDAFPYENRLKSIKDSLKSGYKPLEQAALVDLRRIRNSALVFESDEVNVHLPNKHTVYYEVVHGKHYKSAKVNNALLEVGDRNSCFQTVNDDVVTLTDIVKRRNEIFLIGYVFD